MIDLGDKNHCICKKYDSIPKECINEYRFRDQGKQVQLEPKNREKTTLIAIDNCLITTQSKSKCDCLFIYEKETLTYSFLIELKGKGEIEKAFSQLRKTRDYDEYKNIISHFDIPKRNQKFVIVSDIQLNKKDMQKLENEHNIRVGTILHSDPQSPIPDLKNKLK